MVANYTLSNNDFHQYVRTSTLQSWTQTVMVRMEKVCCMQWSTCCQVSSSLHWKAWTKDGAHWSLKVQSRQG